MFSRFFINRPIFACVLAILMIIAGLVTLHSLPMAQYPDITPPTVYVNAMYPGANAETVAQTVATPIEQQVNGVEGMMYMSSTSGDGSYQLTITFDAGTDIDDATVKVQNRIAEIQGTLPSTVQREGISVQSRSSNMLLFVAIESDNPGAYDALYLTNYANLKMVDPISRIKGVGSVEAFGAGEYSMRVWLKPEVMQARGLTPQDVAAAISSQNSQVSGGQVGAPPTFNADQFQFTLTVPGRLTSPEEFGNIVLRTEDNGAILRLRDVADIDLGAQSYSNLSYDNNTPVGMMGISQTPGANAIEVADACKAELERLAQYMPEGVNYKIILDTTEVIHASIDEVLQTFVETTLIVMVIILIFLQNLRATVIPLITIPVSLIATLAVMKAMDFSLNTLTLFGLVLAIAIVVDDAIVVTEDCQRIVDEGQLTPRQAALKAMRELQGPVVGEVLVLLSVFIPTAFISGITGGLYKQFALTIAVSTAFSGFNALTFTPAMCALFLRKSKQTRFFFFRWFNTAFNWTLKGYDTLVGKFLKHPAAALGGFVVLCILAFWAFAKWPTSYIPEEDEGYFIASVKLPTSASLERSDAIAKEVTEIAKGIPGVKTVMSMVGEDFLAGGTGSNGSTLFVVLEPWKDRGKKEGVTKIIDEFNARCATIQEAIIFGINPPAIPGLGMSSGLEMQLLDINSLGAEAMQQAIDQVQRAAVATGKIKNVRSLYTGMVPQYTLQIDRDKAKMQGLVLDDIYSALGAYMGGSFVNNFVEFGRVYQVIINAEGTARNNVDDVLSLSVRNSSGQMVPFSAFAEAVPTMGLSSDSRYNMYSTGAITATPADGVSSSEGIEVMEQVVRDQLGKNFSYAWTGEAYQETQSGTTVSIVLIFAIIMTILVLAAQYESWTSPIAVVLAMPTAIIGVIVGVIFMGGSISIYSQIGIILLLGLAAKNAILIVEYAIDFHKAGDPILKAAQDGGRIRFRPIIMTALAFVFGIMPLLFASGAGANSRIAIGTAVVFGMAVNAIIGTLFVPNFWALMQHVQEKYLNKVFASANELSNGATVTPTSTTTPPAKTPDNANNI